ncbi:MAG: pantetheine-phosphate adenylyltransferase [Clostridiales bacterium]|nr:pantetheine-phosphate adenylyltransferase [Clostridiales bacterium]
MREPVKGLFAGSFDPYTLGHHAIVKKSARLFDELHILIGVNALKRRQYPARDMKTAIEEALAADGILHTKVIFYEGLVADYCAEEGIRYLVRGLRNGMDYDYEENIAEVNKLIHPELESLYLRADVTAISSSMVRELASYGKDVSPYVPEPVLRLMHRTDSMQRDEKT